MNKRFSISYYIGDTGPKLATSEFDSIPEAVTYVQRLGIGLSRLTITEWDTDNDAADAFGLPEILGSLNLDTAHEMNLTTVEEY